MRTTKQEKLGRLTDRGGSVVIWYLELNLQLHHGIHTETSWEQFPTPLIPQYPIPSISQDREKYHIYTPFPILVISNMRNMSFMPHRDQVQMLAHTHAPTHAHTRKACGVRMSHFLWRHLKWHLGMGLSRFKWGAEAFINRLREWFPSSTTVLNTNDCKTTSRV